MQGDGHRRDHPAQTSGHEAADETAGTTPGEAMITSKSLALSVRG
jgi:hypothetical protein